MRNSLASCCVTACQVASDTAPASTVMSAALAVPLSSTIARAYRRSCTPSVFRGSSVGVTSTFAAPARSVGDAFPPCAVNGRDGLAATASTTISSRQAYLHLGSPCATHRSAIRRGNESAAGCGPLDRVHDSRLRLYYQADEGQPDTRMKNQAQLIAYVDRLPGGTFRDLRELLDGPLGGAFGGVHVLPFFHPIDGADAGFDPIDHTQVDSRLGTWDDVAALAARTDVMADVIVNHISRHSPQFQDFDRLRRRFTVRRPVPDLRTCISGRADRSRPDRAQWPAANAPVHEAPQCARRTDSCSGRRSRAIRSTST